MGQCELIANLVVEGVFVSSKEAQDGRGLNFPGHMREGGGRSQAQHENGARGVFGPIWADIFLTFIT